MDMEVDITSAVRFMPLDTFVLAHPHLFLTGELRRAFPSQLPSAGRVLRADETTLPEGSLRARPQIVVAKIKKRTAGFDNLVALGRGDSCDVVIPDATVSRVHALLRFRNDGLELSDAGSRNGTRANGVVLTGRAIAKVFIGSVIRLGNVDLTIRDARETWDLLRRSALPRS